MCRLREKLRAPPLPLSKPQGPRSSPGKLLLLLPVFGYVCVHPDLVHGKLVVPPGVTVVRAGFLASMQR